MKYSYATIILIVLSATLSATNYFETSTQYKQTTSDYNPLYKNVPTDQVLVRVKDRLKNAYKQYRIDARITSDRTVILTGYVATEKDKMSIEQDILNINGVVKVDNRLDVKDTIKQW
jgi:osmotically-inducible protein OsmY